MVGRKKVELALPGEFGGKFIGCLKIRTMLHEFCAQRLHCGVLLDAVSTRHHDDGLESRSASSKGNRLAMIAPGCRDDAPYIRPTASQKIRVDDPATNLEGADGCVVFMLHPHLGADSPAKQRPAVLGSRCDLSVHKLACRFQLGQGG